MDVAAYGRASAAFDFVFAKHQAQIDEIRRDRSLTAEQRAAAIAALRMRQMEEANTARRRVIEEEKQSLKVYRRHLYALRQAKKLQALVS